MSNAQNSGTGLVRITINPRRRLGRIPAGFIGLGYEISSVAQRGLLAGENDPYIQFVRTLGPAGVIRIGGNTSDYASWSPDGPAVSAPQGTVLDSRSLVDLGAFLRSTGWRLIWGLNLGSGTIEEAVEEAVAVASIIGDRLIAFQIGNEPDLFAGIHRPPDYSYADYYSEYLRYKNSIREKLPDAPFAGPDVFIRSDWFEQFANDDSDVQMLTHHYYAEGPPEDPASTIPNLLNSKIDGLLQKLEAVSRNARRPFRICEANSCFGGGKPGVSDSCAAGLWGLDFLFRLAEFNAAGVNIETGVNHLGFLSWYTPIGVDSGNRYRAAPLYYGMLAFSLASSGTRVSLAVDNAGLNVAAYGVHADRGEIALTVINKEIVSDSVVRVRCPGIAAGRILRLTAPSISATDGIALGGALVDSNGNWTPNTAETALAAGGEVEISVPAASAAIVWLH